MWDSQSLNTAVKQQVFLRTSHEIMNKKNITGTFWKCKTKSSQFFCYKVEIKMIYKIAGHCLERCTPYTKCNSLSGSNFKLCFFVFLF